MLINCVGGTQMSKLGVFFLLLLLPVFAGAQDSCSYLTIKPDTFFIEQYKDSVVFEKLVYTGNKDISYSTCYFHLENTANIKIGDSAITTGVAGPFIFSRFGGFKVAYQKDSIEINTVVKGWYQVYHPGAGSPVIDCRVPVTFVINNSLVPELPGTVPLAIYPNPAQTSTTLKLDKGLTDATIMLYNSIGEKVWQASNITAGYSVTIDCSGLPSGGYVVVVLNGGRTVTGRMQINAVRW